MCKRILRFRGKATACPGVFVFLLQSRLLLPYDGWRYSRLSSGHATRLVPVRAAFRLQLSGFAAPRKSQFKLKPMGGTGEIPSRFVLPTGENYRRSLGEESSQTPYEALPRNLPPDVSLRGGVRAF